MGALDDALLPVFARQHWLVTTDDVLGLGGTFGDIHRRLRAGRWERADRAVFRLVGAPTGWTARVLAPVLSAGPPALASHYAAAALHGIPGIGRGTPELSIPRGTEHRRRDVRVHTSSDLDRCSRVLIDGVPTTDISRTILDIARRSSDDHVLRAMEWARRSDRASWSMLISTLAHHARRGRPGIQRMRRVISEHAHREEITDSDFELLTLALMREAGLPEPELHLRVFDGDRFVAEVDLGYPLLKIAIELDGSIHLDEAVRERDLPRQNDLILLGWTVLRFTWKRFTERPDLVVAEIRAALRAAGPIPA
jgi:predicted transcriptional regulator of viral defense system